MKKILSVLILMFMITPLVFGAVTSNSGIAIQTPNRGIVQFLQGTDAAGTYKTLYTGGANGSKISGIFETNNDASATHLVTCQIKNSTVYYGGVAVTTASNDGFANAVPAKNLMSSANWPGLPIDAWGNPYLILANGDTIACTFATAITSNDVINLVAIGGGDY